MNRRAGETDVCLALCGCTGWHARADAVRLDADNEFSQETRAEGIKPGRAHGPTIQGDVQGYFRAA